MTVWPSVPLEPVAVQRATVRVGKSGVLRIGAHGEPSELPDEWVLRQLADADLDDDDVVATLLSEYGLITLPYFSPGGIPSDRRQRLAPPPPADAGYGWWESRNDGTIEDARWWLRTARALAGVWREASLDGDPPSAWSAEGFPVNSESTCWAMFTVALNVGLRPFHAHVEHRALLPAGEDFVFGLLLVGLYSAACRQVFNLMVEKPTARRCESATCGRVFVRQIGDIEYRQHYRTSGVRFCSPACARAEASRQYRRRKKESKR